MTTTVAPTPTTQAVSEWTKIFPKQVTENYTSSVTFVKQLTVVAISTITYLKNVFPEDSYMIENFGGLKLRILKKNCTNELAQFLTTALTQAFEAFDKKYLHQLALCFYEEECNIENLIEYHIFEYSYNSDEVTLNIHSKNRDNVKRVQKCTFDNVRERTIHMIRACVVIMQTCNYELPSTYDVSIRLYYNDDAPEGYQAPGFLSTVESEDHLEATLNDVIKLGWVETPYHKIITKCYVKDNLRASHEAIASQNPPPISQMDTGDFTGADRTGEVRCACNKIDTDDDTPMLTCWYCQSKQHACCFGIRDCSQVRRHCCELCVLQDATRVPTDGTLHTLTVKKRECLCIFRRTLLLCSIAPAIATRDLIEKFSISEVNATKLIKLLHSHGIVLEDGADLNTSRKIVPEQLKAVMTKFFQNCEEETIVNRLLTETFASQESQSDPVSEVLSPMEKVSLQNATNLGRIIENNTKDFGNNIEDLTLKQYREALISNDDRRDELPFSRSHIIGKNLDNVAKITTKRKMSNEEEKPAMRTGVRTKRAKALPKK